MQVTIHSDKIIVVQRGGATTLLGKYANACRYRTAGGTPPGQEGTYYEVQVFFDAGKGPVSFDTGKREDIFTFDLRQIDKAYQPTWSNTEQGAENAVLDITPFLRAEECCGGSGTPGAVIAVNQAQCWNLLDPQWGLQPEQYTECVIPNIPFCEEEYKGALTDEQKACICEIDPCEDAEYTLKDSAGNTLSSGFIPSGGSDDITAPDGSVQRQDSDGTNIGSPIAVRSGQTGLAVTCPDGTVRTTDGLTTVGAVKSNGTFDLPQSVIKYRDAANASQVTAASDTEFASGTLRPATEVPRRELKLSNGTGLGTFATVDRLIADTLPTCPVAAADSLVEITASGTYTPSANLREIVVFAQAAGGGGGGGRSNSTGGSANGGGAGGSGAYVIRRIPASDLTGPVTVTIGAVGAGGNGGNNGNGTDGGTAGDTSFGAFVIAKGGAGGQGATGTNVTPTNTALASDCTPAFRPWASTGVAPAAQSGSTLNGVDGSAGGVGIAPRGGNGGGRILAGTAFVGGNGGGIYNNSSLTAGAAGASTAGAAGSNGADNVKLDYMALHTTLTPTIGHGTAGGGGAYNASGNGGNGGTGGKGTGGAGGGGCINTATAGRGADGGAGFVVVLQRFNPA